MTPIEATLIVFVIATAIATALFRDVLASIVVFGAYSLGMAVLYTFYRAPDVALTEAAIGAGVTTILLLLTIAKTVRLDHERTFEPISWPAVGVVGFLGALMLATVPSIYPVGDPDAPAWANPEVTGYYIQNAYPETGVENAVMAVLAGYRAFDTFGEAVVVFAAGIAVLIALNREVFT
ncbi:Multisubunit Na+/H+ antiporter, MnhB subunit [Halalkaliarchaeum sp. AArc-CO]|uniref:DUF4040 domain-containing protein n=1 Tax=unclassified Halalkaliarchaeum TaxID=2678344 RepID=UPI00217D293E|nr:MULTISPECIES: DUF4040 domain-containing protein [unclassified Halalkaliarchaeum]MDR5673469.1 DUF4040 domain-containing protein [Halalkaliarchaeum sp. AArc-GB]UWG49855.1 Multisubunit Na+/H+ antiporter, MnhB subunit [Halalkaliarchaeum sp. AArc-CO]